jgi:hypothetical protein
MNLNATIIHSSSRLLLSNATACQVLGNIITMQFYYGGINYAYDQYNSIIWNPLVPIWQLSDIR